MAMIYPTWAAFVAGLPGMGALPRHRTEAWRKGISRPAITQVANVAAALGVGEAEVIAACGHGPYATQREALTARAERERQAKRERWATDPEFRRKLKTYRKSTAKSPHRAKLRAMTPEGRKEYDKANRRAFHVRQRARGYRPPLKPWSVGRIKMELASVKAGLSRCERALSGEWKPWHAYGCWTEKAWSRRCPSAHREHELAHHKAKTYRRGQAGVGLEHFTRDEWRARMKALGYRCSYCGLSRRDARRSGHDLEADHVVPLTRSHGSLSINHINNIVTACKACNSSKSDREPSEWHGYVRGRDEAIDTAIAMAYATVVASMPWRN